MWALIASFRNGFRYLSTGEIESFLHFNATGLRTTRVERAKRQSQKVHWARVNANNAMPIRWESPDSGPENEFTARFSSGYINGENSAPSSTKGRKIFKFMLDGVVREKALTPRGTVTSDLGINRAWIDSEIKKRFIDLEINTVELSIIDFDVQTPLTIFWRLRLTLPSLRSVFEIFNEPLALKYILKLCWSLN